MKKKESKNNKYIDDLKRFWRYIWYDDSFGSYILNFILAFIIIKFIFFPALGFLLNNSYPVVAIVSGSMEHKIVENRVCDKYVVDENYKKLDFNSWWNLCGEYYKKFNISQKSFEEFKYKNGLNIGDVMVLYGKKPKDINVGDVLVFIPQDRNFFETKGPVIHRVINIWQDEQETYHFRTKGDHNPQSFEGFENDISEENVIGVGVIRIPYIGFAKIVLSNTIGKILQIIN